MVLRTLPVWLAAALSPGCSLLGSVDELMPVEARVEGGEVEFHDRAFFQGRWRGCALTFTTEARAVRLKHDGRRLDVTGVQIWWTQWLFGPLLPVIPVLIPGGTNQPVAQCTIELESGDPIRMPLNRMTAVGSFSKVAANSAAGNGTVARACRVVLKRPVPSTSAGGEGHEPAVTETVLTEGDVLLIPKDRLTVEWPMDNNELESLTVTLVWTPDLGGASEEAHCELRFDHEHSVYLAFGLPFSF